MEYPIASRDVYLENGTSQRFNYVLIVDIVPSPHFFCELYGVHISSDCAGCKEHATFRSITADPTEIDELMDLLIQNLVSPTSLNDVVVDWLEQKKSGAELCVGAAD